MILEGDQCKAVFIELLGHWAKRTGVLVGGFVLLNNHCHLCVTPPEEAALSMMMARATACFSRWINVGKGEIGPNWQGAYYASPMDEAHTLAAMRYIERNPVAAGLVDAATDWAWSSARWHCGEGRKPAILTADYRPDGMSPSRWRDLLCNPDPAKVRRRIHAAARTGDALADDAWISRMESKLGIPIRRRPRGRPRENGT